MKKILTKIWNEILFIFTGKGPCLEELINDNVVDYSGQGRDNYGK